MRGDHHHHHLGIDRQQLVQPGQPFGRIGGAAREIGVEQHRVGRTRLDQGQRLFGAAHCLDIPEQPAQQQPRGHQYVLVVVDHDAEFEFRIAHSARSRTASVRNRTINLRAKPWSPLGAQLARVMLTLR